MKKRLAIVRGPNLNSWEMQNYVPLMDEFDITGIACEGHNFDLRSIPFPVVKLKSVGQTLRARALRAPMTRMMGDYHDLQGLDTALKGFDIVHCADTAYYHTYQAALAKRSLGFKLVLTVWENIPFLHHNTAAAANKRVIFEQADRFLAVTERAREVLILEGAPEEKTDVLMQGIDINHFQPEGKDSGLMAKFGCASSDFVILYVANLYREKGIFDLLYAFRALLNRRNNDKSLKLLIAGKGRDRAQVAELIRELGLEQNAILIGPHPYTVMPKIHNLADVFILPSFSIATWQEQFGYVLIESMACGKPVISTLSGSIPEVVGSAGVLVQPNDFLSILAALERLIDDAAGRTEFGRRGRERAEKYFDHLKVAEQLRQFYSTEL